MHLQTGVSTLQSLFKYTWYLEISSTVLNRVQSINVLGGLIACIY